MDGATAYIQSPRVPLNLFQRLVLQWEKIHPYNAAQVLKLSGPADVARLSSAWAQALESLGLGRIHHEPGGLTHHTLNGDLARYPVQVLDERESACDEVSRQLNAPFDDPDEPPFRPFILDKGDHHYAGVSYRHYVADSVSIRMLLREWFLRVYAPEQARRRPLRHVEGGYASLFGPHRSDWSLIDGLLTSVRWASRNRRVARVEHPAPGDYSAAFTLYEAGCDLITPLLDFARGQGATLNDLFLAVLAQTCNRFVPLKRTARRTDIALGTIVDLRPYAPQNLSDTFGLFLGFTSTLCRPADLKDFNRLLRQIAAQSALHKSGGMALSSPIRVMAALTAGRFYSRKRIVEFYRKRVPLAGGISNVNLNRTWAAQFHPAPLLDYIRVSPTGPMMPLVFTPTTLGKHLHLGMTHRPALIPDDKARAMAEFFLARLREIAGLCTSG